MKDSRAPLKTTEIFSSSDGLRALAATARDCKTESIVLQHLAADTALHPEKLKLVDARLMSRISSLVLGVDVDLDAPLLSADD